MPDSNLIVVAAVGIGIILVIVILVMISTRRKLARGDRTIRASRPLPTKKGHTFKDGTLTITSRKSTPDSKRYIGKIIGDWKIMGRIGGGGMATVYKAMGIGEDNLDIVAALKIPSEQFIHIPQFVQRFRREARISQNVSHPNIVKVLDSSSTGSGDTLYMAMEFLDGVTLDNILKQKKTLSITEALDIMKQIGGALAHLHRRKIVHRDIKPSNIMIIRDGTAKLMDLGVARDQIVTGFTVTGARLGTPIYMSPEQARGDKVSPQADIYSLGLILYEMLTGTLPFKGDDMTVMHRHIYDDPRPPRAINPEMPAAIEAIILKMLRKDLKERYESMEDVLRDLEDFEAGATAVGLRRIVEAPEKIFVVLNTRKDMIREYSLEGDLIRGFGNYGVGSNMFSKVPTGIAVDLEGNIYIITFDDTAMSGGGVGMVKKYDSRGRLLLKFGGYGTRKGEFLSPSAIALDEEGLVYVADGETHSIQKFDEEGIYRLSFGERGSGEGQFKTPSALAIDSASYVFVVDRDNGRIQKFSSQGHFVKELKVRGDDGQPLRRIGNMAVDKDDFLYVVDVKNSKVRKLDGGGELVDTFETEEFRSERSGSLSHIASDRESFYLAYGFDGWIYRVDNSWKLLQKIGCYEKIVALAVRKEIDGN